MEGNDSIDKALLRYIVTHFWQYKDDLPTVTKLWWQQDILQVYVYHVVYSKSSAAVNNANQTLQHLSL